MNKTNNSVKVVGKSVPTTATLNTKQVHNLTNRQPIDTYQNKPIYNTKEELLEAHQYYQSIGLATIPVLTGTKNPFLKSWNVLGNPLVLRLVGKKWKSHNNLGGRAINGWFVLDSDSEYTTNYIIALFNQLGLCNYMLVQSRTAGHASFWLKCNDMPNFAQDRIHLIKEFDGDIRCGASAQALLPSSVVDGAEYTFIEKINPDLPVSVIAWSDLSPIINTSKIKDAKEADDVYIPHAIKRSMSQLNAERLAFLEKATKGESFETSPSRSELEMVFITSMIASGYSKNDLMKLLQNTTRYIEKDNPKEYSAMIYKCMSYVSSNKFRQNVAIILKAVECIPMTDRTSCKTLLNVYLMMAYQYATIDVLLSNVEMQENAVLGSVNTVKRNRPLLVELGFITMLDSRSVRLNLHNIIDYVNNFTGNALISFTKGDTEQSLTLEEVIIENDSLSLTSTATELVNTRLSTINNIKHDVVKLNNELKLLGQNLYYVLHALPYNVKLTIYEIMEMIPQLNYSQLYSILHKGVKCGFITHTDNKEFIIHSMQSDSTKSILKDYFELCKLRYDKIVKRIQYAKLRYDAWMYWMNELYWKWVDNEPMVVT